MCISFIRRHINMLPQDALFTTRDCLIYGKRAAVDQALSRLARSGYITRMARGVFVRMGARSKLPAVAAVAGAKALAFNRTPLTFPADVAAAFGLAQWARSGGDSHTFLVNGHTSSFLVGDVRVRLQGVCQRRIRAANTKSGDIARALWQLGRALCTPQMLDLASVLCGRRERQELRKHVTWLPSWLGDNFAAAGFAAARVVAAQHAAGNFAERVSYGVPLPLKL